MAEQKNVQPSFEQAIKRLETLVEQMESGKLPLEELLNRYEEGVRLVKACTEKLSAAEKRIEIITRDNGGKPVIAEFESSANPESTESSDASLF